MTFVILEGNEKVGKSTVAKLYAEKGYQIVHFSAPPKKYSQPGYAGPSYLDDLIERLMPLSGKDVLFDRSWYGELVWPQVFGRMPVLSEEDFELLKEIEEQNSVERYLIIDPNSESHWQRCLDHKEPVNRYQFDLANRLFASLGEKHGFSVKTFQEFLNPSKHNNGPRHLGDWPQQTQAVSETNDNNEQNGNNATDLSSKRSNDDNVGVQILTPEQKRLAEANAINDVLSKQIIKQKGEHYSIIEAKIRDFLNNEMAILLGTKQFVSAPELTIDEIKFIKTLMKKMSDKR